MVAPSRAGCLAVFGHHRQAWDNRRCGGRSPTMTARADRLTKRAKTAGSASSVRSSYPASSARVFVDALERLNYSVEPLALASRVGGSDTRIQTVARTLATSA